MKSKLWQIKIWVLIWLYKNLKGYSKVSTKLLFSQATHETGYFESEVFKQNKNLFGMRHPSVRKTYSTGSNLGHAVFKSHLDSIRDYFERQKYFNIPNEVDTVYIDKTLESNYAEDPLYRQKWIANYERNKMPINNNLLYLGLFFFGVFLVWLIIKKSNK